MAHDELLEQRLAEFVAQGARPALLFEHSDRIVGEPDHPLRLIALRGHADRCEDDRSRPDGAEAGAALAGGDPRPA